MVSYWGVFGPSNHDRTLRKHPRVRLGRVEGVSAETRGKAGNPATQFKTIEKRLTITEDGAATFDRSRNRRTPIATKIGRRRTYIKIRPRQVSTQSEKVLYTLFKKRF